MNEAANPEAAQGGRGLESKEESAIKKRAVEAEQRPSWIITKTNGGRGDCLPLAVSQGLNQLGKEKTNASKVRIMAVAMLAKMKSEMEAFWDGLPPRDSDTRMEGTFDDYLSELAKKGAWMGAMEVGALAKATGHPMEIYRIGAPPCVYGRGNKKQPIRLWYHKKTL